MVELEQQAIPRRKVRVVNTVRILTAHSLGGGRDVAVGDEVTLPEDDAKYRVSMGWAEYVHGRDPEAEERDPEAEHRDPGDEAGDEAGEGGGASPGRRRRR